MDAKDQKKKYGVTMGPISCTEAWRRKMPFDHKDTVTTWSYILINRYAGTRTHVNLYNDATGPGYNATKNTHPIGDDKKLAKSLNIGKPGEYQRCPIKDCAVAVFAEATAENLKLSGGVTHQEPSLSAPPPKAADITKEPKPGIKEASTNNPEESPKE